MMIPRWTQVVLFHGWGGIDRERATPPWLLWLARALEQFAGITVWLVEFPSPKRPSQVRWVRVVSETIEKVREAEPNPDRILVICHSLGCIAWLRYLQERAIGTLIVGTVLLVAPPYVNPYLRPNYSFPGVPSFFRSRFANNATRAAVETVILAGEDDPLAGLDQTGALGKLLGVMIYVIAGGEHLSPGSGGCGDWPWLLKFVTGEADLPPVSRTGEVAQPYEQP